METLKLKNKTIDYFKFGQGEKTFVIISGLSVKSIMESEKTIVNDYAKFSDEYTVYCFDRRREIDEGYSIDDMADDYIDALNALKQKDVYVFGASQGGMIAMCVAIKSDLIKSMVLGSTTPVLDEKAQETLNGWVTLAKEKRREELYLSFGEAMFTDDIYDAVKEIMRKESKTVTDTELERFAICGDATKGFDVFNRLKDIKCDTLFISDKTDKLFGDVSGVIDALKLDNIKAVALDGYGHVSYDLAPNYKDIIYRFFNGESINERSGI